MAESKRRVQRDIVIIRYRRNRAGIRIITAFTVRGNIRPCQGVLTIGRRLRLAVRCLLQNGFRIRSVSISARRIVLTRRRAR
jgi:hypothetical protein